MYYGLHARASGVSIQASSASHSLNSAIIGKTAKNCQDGGVISAENVSVVVRKARPTEERALKCKSCVVAFLNSDVSDAIYFICRNKKYSSDEAVFQIREGGAFALSGRFRIGSNIVGSSMILEEGEVFSETRFPLLGYYQRPLTSTYKLHHGDYVHFIGSNGLISDGEGYLKVHEGSLSVNLRTAASLVVIKRNGVANDIKLKLFPDPVELVSANPFLSLMGIVFSLTISISSYGRKGE
jgi:hypothetical protein